MCSFREIHRLHVFLFQLAEEHLQFILTEIFGAFFFCSQLISALVHGPIRQPGSFYLFINHSSLSLNFSALFDPSCHCFVLLKALYWISFVIDCFCPGQLVRQNIFLFMFEQEELLVTIILYS